MKLLHKEGSLDINNSLQISIIKISQSMDYCQRTIEHLGHTAMEPDKVNISDIVKITLRF